MSGLDAHGLTLLIFTGVIFAAFIWDRLPIATVCLGILVLLPLGFALFPYPTAQGAAQPLRFFAGFGHPALVAICGLMILGHGLVVTGALEPAARRLTSFVAAAPRMALLLVLVGAAAASGLINDTPVVVLLIPLIISAARRAKISPGTMLMPMNYAVLVGGMATTIGTSTNLIVVAIASDLGIGPFSMFSFYTLVMLAALPALAYLWFIAPWLLTHVSAPAERLLEQVFDAELHVEPESWLDGKKLGEIIQSAGRRMNLVEVRRGELTLTRLPSLMLRAGDRLLLRDTAANLKEFESALHARLHGMNFDAEHTKDDEAGAEDEADTGDEPTPASAVVAQMIVTPDSPLVGRSVRSLNFAERYGVIVVGQRPRESLQGWQRENLTDRQIGSGDILLLEGEPEAMQEAQHDGIGLLLDESFALPRQEKATTAMLVMAVVVVLAATKTLPIALAALGGVLLLLLTQSLSWREVAQSLSAKVVLLITASLALGDALHLTGATTWLAHLLAVASAGLQPAWVLALLMALMGLMTNFVSNTAAAAIGTPLGVELARSLGAPPEAFVLAVLFGCNLCYLTPMGYQTNLLVMNAGGYRFGDFMRVGAPLFAIMWAGLSYGLILRYGL